VMEAEAADGEADDSQQDENDSDNGGRLHEEAPLRVADVAFS
jgi:hypothetical protein